MEKLKIGTRAIQKIGGSLFVNTPQIWVDNNNITKGDYVELTITPEGHLLITPKKTIKVIV